MIRAMFCFLFMLWLIVAKAMNLLSFVGPVCIRDNFLEMTKSMNDYLRVHPTLLKVMIVATSWNIDVLILCFSFLFIFYYRSWRLCIWALMFYIARSLIQVEASPHT